MTARRALALAAVTLLAVGLLFGFLPTSRGGVSCGSAFVGNQDAAVADLGAAMDADRTGAVLDTVGGVQAACTAARTGRRTPSVIVLVLGGVAALAAGVTRPPGAVVEH